MFLLIEEQSFPEFSFCLSLILRQPGLKIEELWLFFKRWGNFSDLIVWTSCGEFVSNDSHFASWWNVLVEDLHLLNTISQTPWTWAKTIEKQLKACIANKDHTHNNEKWNTNERQSNRFTEKTIPLNECWSCWCYVINPTFQSVSKLDLLRSKWKPFPSNHQLSAFLKVELHESGPLALPQLSRKWHGGTLRRLEPKTLGLTV